MPTTSTLARFPLTRAWRCRHRAWMVLVSLTCVASRKTTRHTSLKTLHLMPDVLEREGSFNGSKGFGHNRTSKPHKYHDAYTCRKFIFAYTTYWTHHWKYASSRSTSLKVEEIGWTFSILDCKQLFINGNKMVGIASRIAKVLLISHLLSCWKKSRDERRVW